jgi:hypothetical protein
LHLGNIKPLQEGEISMNKKGFSIIAVCILSASIVFAMGKVDAVDNGTETNIKGHIPSFEDVNNAKTPEDKKVALKNIIMIPIVEKNDAINQDKYEAAFQLMSMEHTKEDLQVLVDQVKKDQYWEYKKNLLDAMSISPYKDITGQAYKNIAETEGNLYLRGLATHLFIKTGDEKKGYELLEKLFEYMNGQNELAYYYNGVNAFSDPEMKKKVEDFILNLRDDKSKGNVIRSYAAIICHQKYKSDLKPYYPMIEKTILNNDIKESAAKYILDKMKYIGGENQEAIEIINSAAKSGNEKVKEIIRKMNK